jgi:transcriptional regulator with XRE-family HTH domain
MEATVILTPRHSRAARGLLGWTQAFLAIASQVSEIAIKNLERGSSDPRASTLRKIEETFEMVGVEFSNGNSPGVRLKIIGNPDLLYRQAWLAAEAIGKGKGLDDFVPDKGDVGREFNVRKALLIASVQLPGDFSDEAWNAFQKAFKRLESSPSSRAVTECCRALILACDAQAAQ